MPASDELFGARPACKGGIGARLALAWRRLGVPADYPCPEQGPVLVPGGRLGNGAAAALNSVGVAAGLRRCRRPGSLTPPRQVQGVAGLPKLAIMPASPGAQT